MSDFPTTRVSLLLRLRDRANQAAWDEFAAVYRPVIYRFARKRGLQEADAQDLVQNVLAAVAERIGDWEPNEDRARFRSWLCRVASNQTITMYRKRKPDAGRGGTTALAVLASQEADASDLELNYRREVFRLMARKAKAEFGESTWQAFWLTAVEGVSVKEAAQSLGRTVGSIYTARSRVMHRLQQLVTEYRHEAPGATADWEVAP